MKKFRYAFLVAVALAACDKSGTSVEDRDTYDFQNVAHDEIVLGERLENPYKTVNVVKACASLYPTKGREVVETTDLYVRFLPEDDGQFNTLEALGLDMLDHPLDYSIKVEGDYYRDPSVGEDAITWQYALVPRDFSFPEGIRYEIIDECFLSEHHSTKAGEGIDWDAVEREAYRLTGNGGMLESPTKADSEKSSPSGRICIVDEDAFGGKPVGVAGVKVVCNSFVRFGSAYTDRDGFYKIDKQYSAKLRYRLMFKNEKGFSIGLNLIIVPASVSTLGKASPEGVSVTVTKDSDAKLFRRCAVNNSAYDFYCRCGEDDLGITPPPSGLRIWILPFLSSSAAMMTHHGTIIDNAAIAAFLTYYALIVKLAAPDVVISTKDQESFSEIYDLVCHELAHACHYAQVGNAWWDKYIWFIVQEFAGAGETSYGSGSEANSGYCEVGEMWAYFLESKMHKDRYGGATPAYGTSWWFYPQIFRYLDDRGVSTADIYAALTKDVTDRESLRTKLVALNQSKKSLIEQVFTRYAN